MDSGCQWTKSVELQLVRQLTPFGDLAVAFERCKQPLKRRLKKLLVKDLEKLLVPSFWIGLGPRYDRRREILKAYQALPSKHLRALAVAQYWVINGNAPRGRKTIESWLRVDSYLPTESASGAIELGEGSAEHLLRIIDGLKKTFPGLAQELSIRLWQIASENERQQLRLEMPDLAAVDLRLILKRPDRGHRFFALWFTVASQRLTALEAREFASKHFKIYRDKASILESAIAMIQIPSEIWLPISKSLNLISSWKEAQDWRKRWVWWRLYRNRSVRLAMFSHITGLPAQVEREVLSKIVAGGECLVECLYRLIELGDYSPAYLRD